MAGPKAAGSFAKPSETSQLVKASRVSKRRRSGSVARWAGDAVARAYAAIGEKGAAAAAAADPVLKSQFGG